MMGAGPASCARTPSMRILRQRASKPGAVSGASAGLPTPRDAGPPLVLPTFVSQCHCPCDYAIVTLLVAPVLSGCAFDTIKREMGSAVGQISVQILLKPDDARKPWP